MASITDPMVNHKDTTTNPNITNQAIKAKKKLDKKIITTLGLKKIMSLIIPTSR